jgi:hypothetical protein
MKKSPELDPLAPRPNLDFSKGVRGKYTNLLKHGTNLVILDPALMPHFPDSESVNVALRAFLAIGRQVESATIHVVRKPVRGANQKRTASFDPRVGVAPTRRSATK